MKVYAWNPDKNDLLIKERDISFEDIVLNINIGNELDVYEIHRIEESIIFVLEKLVEASYSKNRKNTLQQANLRLELVRHL